MRSHCVVLTETTWSELREAKMHWERAYSRLSVFVIYTVLVSLIIKGSNTKKQNKKP